MTASSSVIDSVSPRRSGRKIKPSAFSDDSTYVNTLNTSLIPSDQEMDENSKVQKKKKKKVNKIINTLLKILLLTC